MFQDFEYPIFLFFNSFINVLLAFFLPLMEKCALLWMFLNAFLPMELRLPAVTVIFFKDLHFSKAELPIFLICFPMFTLVILALFRKAFGAMEVTLYIVPFRYMAVGIFIEAV